MLLPGETLQFLNLNNNPCEIYIYIYATYIYMLPIYTFINKQMPHLTIFIKGTGKIELHI